MPDDTASRIAGNIRAELARRDIYRYQLAQAIGMDEASLAKRLRGERHFKVPELEAIAEYLDLSVTDLFGTTP